jgi:hypothetical protein
MGQIWPGPAAGRPVVRLAAHDQQSRGALAVDALWRRSGRLQPAGGDGRWGTAARARGGGEGPIGGGRGIDGGSLRTVHGGAARRGEAGDGGEDRWSSEGSVMGYTSEWSSWRQQQGQSVVEGGGACGGARGGSGREDLAAEVRWGTESAVHLASSEVGVGGLL